VDFSLRRTHGIDAGMKVARSSYLAGFAGTSNVLAGQRYGIPIVGTMAHSFVSSFEHERDAFRAFVASFPDQSILLIDTYDTVSGARTAVEIAREMAARGPQLQGVRIDSGDLAKLALEVRNVFNEAGLPEVKIVGSGGLDEYDLKTFSDAQIPYDSYGVGTKMGVSADAPWSDIAYKLVEYDQRPVLKLSTGKISLPGGKQVFRLSDNQGYLKKDIIALQEEQVPEAEPLLKTVMAEGKFVAPLPSLDESRLTFLSEFVKLRESIKSILKPEHYPVEQSIGLQKLYLEVEEQIRRSH
jgi:nicotinate phosphoribosyltransferase